MVHEYATNSPELHSSGFEFSVFPSHLPVVLPRLKNPSCLTIRLEIGSYIFEGQQHKEQFP